MPSFISLGCYSSRGVVKEKKTVVETRDGEVVTIKTFREELDGDGEWIKITKEEILPDGESVSTSETIEIDNDLDVEYIWRPYNVHEGWSPYTNGRWVFSNQGWVWVSNYNWGWAPYHYGRWWFSSNYGWVWSPGHTWAPCWVHWRWTEGSVGWYPMSPWAHWEFRNNVIISHPVTVNEKVVNNKWVFVNKNEFTNVISKKNIIDIKNNKEISSNTEIREDEHIKYSGGPDVKEIESATGKTITPKKVSITNDKSKVKNDDKSLSVYKHKNIKNDKLAADKHFKGKTDKGNGTDIHKKDNKPIDDKLRNSEHEKEKEREKEKEHEQE
ncbi:MAG: hypothetical protein PHN88_04475 [Ignavibacteria bacterium]|nr:hypothetical protein [Ignavibacteria bacterium]